MTGGLTIFYIAFSSAAIYLEHVIPFPSTPDKSLGFIEAFKKFHHSVNEKTLFKQLTCPIK